MDLICLQMVTFLVTDDMCRDEYGTVGICFECGGLREIVPEYGICRRCAVRLGFLIQEDAYLEDWMEEESPFWETTVDEAEAEP